MYILVYDAKLEFKERKNSNLYLFAAACNKSPELQYF
ncbi:hypothetical protein SAMN05216490_3086 [Mucilaginibacter mallensis]|uniref:Uncharacterized protein n=1 Tax=Mucilaginibacter mallensis TaxID=652787 RepID=A0A1H1ZGE3_MUCMA|nr:hypothetical protein [Mucilaginibacter sp. X5P1]SDT32276.1 hypothetical protein SAMN05216490_3086 [Mucilaginibacter mallensis]